MMRDDLASDPLVLLLGTSRKAPIVGVHPPPYCEHHLHVARHRPILKTCRRNILSSMRPLLVKIVQSVPTKDVSVHRQNE